MPHRHSSPAISESGIDVFNDLTQHNDESIGEHYSSQQLARGDGSAASGKNEDEDEDAFTALTNASQSGSFIDGKSKGSRKGGGFQSMGLGPALLRAISRKGYSQPTPIQRRTIPMVLEGNDVVGMARTGSGKTAAFVVPMIKKLQAHSVQVGARALIMSPSRELALQTLKVVKELGKGTDLRAVLLVGGNSLEDHFASMMSNPDIIVATPGRFLHLKVEMGLDLSTIRYVVFDEADRLFEMGFAVQLTEILHQLPPNRQTLLFSATLPKSLVEFTKAGLQDPKLVRLDADSKISPDLKSAFFMVKSADKDGALLHLLQDVLKVPLKAAGAPNTGREHAKSDGRKRKRDNGVEEVSENVAAQSTIVFAATKHQVEYLASLVAAFGYSASYVYGSLDQSARLTNVSRFRSGETSVLIVTDVAARGIDIPMVSNVINYDFPSQPKVFVHRVGRTARAGRQGWSYSLVRDADLPYLLDLQLFLGRRLVLGRESPDHSFTRDIIVGCLVKNEVEKSGEWASKLVETDVDLEGLQTVASKGEKLYLKTRPSASVESVKRAKDLVRTSRLIERSPLFADVNVDDKQTETESMLSRISGFRPKENIFEIGKRGSSGAGILPFKRKQKPAQPEEDQGPVDAKFTSEADQVELDAVPMAGPEGDHAIDDPSTSYHGEEDGGEEDDEEEVEVTVGQARSHEGTDGRDEWKDSEHFMSYEPKGYNVAEDRGYSVHSQGADFHRAAGEAMLDLNGDEGSGFRESGGKSRPSLKWDKKARKYISTLDSALQNGKRGNSKKLMVGESGQRIAASFKSGKFEAWKKAHRIERVQDVGEREGEGGNARMKTEQRTRKHKHQLTRAPKDPDKYRDDYEKQKKRVEVAKANRVGKYKTGPGKSELRGVEQVHKLRKAKEKRQEKNARPGSKRRK